ncbi:MAG: hypothetical protein AAF799_31865 [Myxococcota bacterium]
MPGRNEQQAGWLIVAAIGLVSCDDPEPAPLPPRDVAGLVDLSQWTPVPAADDAWPERRVPGGVCEAGEGYYVEPLAGTTTFKVDTTLCDGITVAQPALADIRLDEVIRFDLWHFPLVAEAPAEGFLALAIDGEPVWEHRVPIPQGAGLITEFIELPAEVPQGAEIQFHIDNHGDNTWMLLGLQREPG